MEITVKKIYGDKIVLDVERLIFESGKRYALIGANGCGKTTLLQIIGGIVKADIFKNDLQKHTRACYMPQSSIGFSMSVKNNILLGLSATERKQCKGRAVSLANALNLKSLMRKNAARLSGGETQRVALARSLVSECDLLLLDEPTASMDVNSAMAAEEVILEYAERTNSTLIFASHSFGQVQRLADEVIFMHEGKIVERGIASELLNYPKTAEAKRFLDFLRNK